MPYKTSQEADAEFALFNSGTPEAVLEHFRYLEKERELDFPNPLFEYDTDHNHAWYLLGLAYEALEDKRRAADCFLTAIKIWPQDADSYVAYSNVEPELDKIPPVLERGIDVTNDDRIRLNLANTYLDLKIPTKALVHLEKISDDVDFYHNVTYGLKIAKEMDSPRSGDST